MFELDTERWPLERYLRSRFTVVTRIANGFFASRKIRAIALMLQLVLGPSAAEAAAFLSPWGHDWRSCPSRSSLVLHV